MEYFEKYKNTALKFSESKHQGNSKFNCSKVPIKTNTNSYNNKKALVNYITSSLPKDITEENIIEENETLMQKIEEKQNAISDYKKQINILQEQLTNLQKESIIASNKLIPYRDRRTCVICQDDLDKEENPTKLPCGDTFHFYCFAQWKITNKNCPKCGKLIPF